MDTPPKFPSPHNIYDRTPSSVAAKFSRETTDDTTNPVMIPTMSSMTGFLTRKEKNMMMAVTANAPASAAERMAA